MPDHRNHRLYLADIADSSHAILEYTQGLSLEAFCRDRKTYSAVTREFEIIGEAVGKIPASIKQDYKHLVLQSLPEDIPTCFKAALLIDLTEILH